MTGRVLVVEDDAPVREALGQSLELAGLAPVLAASFVVAKDHIAPEFDGIVLADIRMPGKDGFHLLAHARGIDADLPVILLTGEGDIPMAVRAMSEGAFDFLEKPCAPARLIASVGRALRTRTLVMENRQLSRQLEQGDAAARAIIGASPAAQGLRAELRRAARTRAPVLITGEAGTGTIRVAETLHQLDTARAPFLRMAAATLEPAALRRAMDEAAGGTLVIEDIEALPAALQSATAAALAGFAGRAVATTADDLEAAALGGAYSDELFYFFAVIRLTVPALRDRADDIPALFRHFVRLACEQAALPVPEIPADVIAAMCARDWPGNARALQNAAMRFALGLGEVAGAREGGLAERMAAVERALIAEALRLHAGNATATAVALKLPRKTFYDRINRLGIRPEDYR